MTDKNGFKKKQIAQFSVLRGGRFWCGWKRNVISKIANISLELPQLAVFWRWGASLLSVRMCIFTALLSSDFVCIVNPPMSKVVWFTLSCCKIDFKLYISNKVPYRFLSEFLFSVSLRLKLRFHFTARQYIIQIFQFLLLLYFFLPFF